MSDHKSSMAVLALLFLTIVLVVGVVSGIVNEFELRERLEQYPKLSKQEVEQMDEAQRFASKKYKAAPKGDRARLEWLARAKYARALGKLKAIKEAKNDK